MTSSKAFVKFCKLYFNSPDRVHLRMGQFFVGRYIKEPWPDLFYQTDDSIAGGVIRKWLEDFNYIDDLPHEVQR